MSNLKRFGYFYNRSSMTIPVGSGTLFPMQKIHSNHSDFDKIDVRYIQQGYLVFEQGMAVSALSRYSEYGDQPQIFNHVVVTTDTPEGEVIVTEGTPAEKIESAPATPEVIEALKEAIQEIPIENGQVINEEEIAGPIEEVNEIPEGETVLESVEIVGSSETVETPAFTAEGQEEIELPKEEVKKKTSKQSKKK